jgi:hypothetical protein
MTAHRRRVLLLLPALVAACSFEPELSAFPGAAQQVRRLYEARAMERNAGCTLMRMRAITGYTVLSDTPERLVLSVRYGFEPFNRMSEIGQDACIGFGERTFVFARTGSALTLVEMGGEQRGEPTPLRDLLALPSR